MKRILVLALALILAVSSLGVPSYAAEVVPDAIVDLKYGVEYFLYQNDSLFGSKASPYEWFANITKFRADWTISNTVQFRTIIVGVIADRVPDAVYIGNSSPGKAYCAYDRSVGNVHYFQTWDFLDITQAIQVHVDFNSAYTGWVGVDTIYGLYSDSIDVTNVNYFSNAWIYDTVDPGDGVGFAQIHQVDSESNASLPVFSDWSGPSGSEVYHLDHGEMFVKVPYSSHNLNLASSITYLIYSAGEIYDVGARLEDSSGNILADLSATVSGGGESQIVWQSYENIHRLKVYTVTVDLTGYELRNKYISLSYNIDRVFASYVYEYDYGFYTQVTGIAVSKMTSDTPWYSIFALWLKGQYNSIRSLISEGFNNTVANIQSVGNTMAAWFEILHSQVVQGFNNTIANIQNFNNTTVAWFESINGTLHFYFQQLVTLLSPSADTDGFQDQVDDQGDRLDQMDDALSSVTKPALDRVDTNISGIVSDTDLANTAHVYTYIIDDNIMAPALTMVTILAMMSFALFGKR